MTRNETFSRFYALLAKMPGADKEELVWQFSNMLTPSLREFYQKNPEGYKRMLANMQMEVSRTSPGSEQKEIIKKLRSAILFRLQKHGVDTTSWSAVNHFLECPRIAGKRLYELNIEEMSRLIHKLESILEKDARIKQQEQKIASMN